MNMWQIVSGGHKNLHGRVGLMILKLQQRRACSVSHPSSLAPAPSPNGPATSPSSEERQAKHTPPIPPYHSSSLDCPFSHSLDIEMHFFPIVLEFRFKKKSCLIAHEA